ncbi:eukaryotic translation initiation factor 4G-like [Zingiber officinale]|uniref:eukaryotic translation initiation factor 4G-like n=1 Tax=Zingiber officinale TaxID=94328 RepID=UPI001C4D0E27|nr:eukaryotic translation initiation factor 4G-like [Zingiber officinale]XP_042390387.1 eukaryotic translation initiation factor 4G-like [Zingiber officinale]
MSVNQSRVERTEAQIKKSSRSGSAGQQRGFVGSGGGGGWKGGVGGVSAPPPISSTSSVPPSSVSPSLSTSRSFKKSFNGQSQSTTSRGNASSEASGAAASAAGHHALENGAQPQTHSLGFSDGLDPRAAKPVDMPIPRSASRAIPKPPSSQSSAGFSNSQAPSAPAKGDASKITLQFGSINPGIMNGLQIPVPARTSSAPPNLDEQIRNQARTESFRAAPKMSAPSIPKQQQLQTKKDVVGVHQSSSGESHSVHVKRDLTAPVPSAPVVPAPKSSALPITGSSFPIAMPFQPQQLQVPAQFGGSNVQLQSPGLAANSMQMPIALPVGNNPQVAQQIYVPSIQSHFMQQQAMMHPGQGLGFVPPIGHPLPQQLGGLGIGISQFSQQHSGKYGTARKTTVKITHPDTHEELKLDKNIDTFKDSLSAAQKTLPNVIPPSQSVPTYAASHQMNFFTAMQQTSYSRPQLMYSTNVPLASGQMPASSQAPRLSYPVSQSGQKLTYLNSSMSNAVPSGKPVSSAALRGFSEGVNLDTLPVSAPMSNAVQVTIKPSVGSQSVNAGVFLSTPSVVISMPSTKTEPSKSVKATEENTNSKQKQTVSKPDEPAQQLKSASGQLNTVKLLVNETTSTNAVPVVSTQTVQCEHLSVSETTGDSGSDLAGNDGRKNEPVQRSDSFKNNWWKSSKNDLRTQQRHQLDAFSTEGAKVSPTSENTVLLNVEAIEQVEVKVMLAESSSFKEVLKKETLQDASLGYADSSKEIPSESPSLCQIIDGIDTKSINSNSRVANTVSEVRKDRILEVVVSEQFKVSDDSSKDPNDFEVLPSSTHSKSSEQVNAVASSEQESHVGNFGKVRSGHYDKVIDKLLNDSTSDVGSEMQEERILNLQNRPTNAYLDAADSETIINSLSTEHEMKSDKDIDLIDSGVARMETVNVCLQPLSVEHKPELKHLDLNSECKPESKPLDSCSDALVSATGLGQTEKPLSEIPKPKISTGKKKKREMLSKADAADTSDLYTAYKGPEEEHTAKKSESINNSTVVKNITQIGNLSKDAASNEEDMHNRAELDDWENAADISTPKLKATDDQPPINDARKQHKKVDGYEATSRNKYSRDFLMTLSQYFTHLPINFQTGSDITDALLVNLSGHSPSASTGRVNDRPSGASRVDRRIVASMDDEKWLKPQVSFGRDNRTDYGHGNATVSLRPGQAGSHVILRTLPRQTSNQGILSGPMPSPVAQVGLPRGNPDADRWQRARGLIPSPHTPLQVMHKAEKKYEVGKVSDEEAAKQRQLKAILNKLTPQNFDKLFDQVREVNIDNAMTLTGVISQIFDKALMEPTFCEMYANFCFRLATVLPDFSEDNEKITFKRLLLNKCQEEFERGEKEQAEANKDEEEGETKQFKEEREAKRLQARRRMLGNIRLIGELYKKKMLTERIMHECIKKLLGQYQNPDEEDIEALCKLMSTIGEMIDHPKAKEHMDAYFDMMAKLSTSQKLSSRVRFMLRDAIDLRKNKWQQRRKVEGPKKIDEVHRDAAQERQAQSSRLSRGPIISNVPRRGPAADYGSRGPTLLTPPGIQQQVSGIRGLPSRGYGIQDVWLEDRHHLEGRTMSLPLQHRSAEDDSITLGPQGGLARGMSIRGQPSISNMSSGEIASVVGEHRPISSSTNDTNYMAERSSGAIFDEPSPGYQNNHQSSRDSKISDRTFERSSTAMLPAGRTHGTSMSSQSTPETRIFSEEVLREKFISAIREFYSAEDEKEVALCIKELNAPDFYPSMISLWVTDSFEKTNTERDLLAKLIINFCKSRDSLLSQAQLLHGFELVLSSLEDAVNDAPRAAEFLGRLFTKVILQNVVTLKDIGKLIQEGGEEPGQLKEIGLAAEVLGNILESIRSESGDAFLNEIRASSNLRLKDFRPPHPLKANKLDEFL